MVQLEIFNQKHLHDINEKFGFNLTEGIRMDPKAIKILEIIISGIAKHNNETTEEVRSRFKKSLFTGEILHIRDIEKAFGEGALKKIKKWQQINAVNIEEASKIEEDTIEYFEKRYKSIESR